MGKIVQPKLEEVGRIIGELIGKKVTVTSADGPCEPSHVGVFLFRDNSTGMIAAGDVAAVAYTGSALVMIPKGAADDAVSSGSPNEMQVDCFQEVMNVVSQAWNLAGGDHIRLVKTEPVGALTPDESNLLTGGSTQLHVNIEVDGYGTGRLTFGGV